MLLDLLAGRPSEIDVINGAIPSRVAPFGRPGQLHLTALVHATELGGMAPARRALSRLGVLNAQNLPARPELLVHERLSDAHIPKAG